MKDFINREKCESHKMKEYKKRNQKIKLLTQA